MTDTELRDAQHAAQLETAREIVEGVCNGSQGMADGGLEVALRSIARMLYEAERKLREGLVIRKARVTNGQRDAAPA